MSPARFCPPEHSATVAFSWESAWRPAVGASFARARLSLRKTGLLYACGLKASTLKLYRTCANRQANTHLSKKRYSLSLLRARIANDKHTPPHFFFSFRFRFRFLLRRLVRGGSRSETAPRDLSTRRRRSTHSSHVDIKRAKATMQKQRGQRRHGPVLKEPRFVRGDSWRRRRQRRLIPPFVRSVRVTLGR